MRNIAIVGAGMTRFGKYKDRGLKSLTDEAVTAALDSAGMDKSALEVAVVGNATAGLITGQECIRAQVVLRSMGIDKIPMVNTENACASSSTAFQLAWMYVASGMYDVAQPLHGHLRGGRARPHGEVRDDEGAVRAHRRQESQQRQPQPARAVPRA